MKLGLVAKVKEFKAKEAGGDPQATITVEGTLSYSEIGQLAKFLGKTVVLNLVLQQGGLFDDEEDRSNGYHQTTLEDAMQPEEDPAPATCSAPAVYAIRYEAGDGCQGTLFACADHVGQVTAMALEHSEQGGGVGRVSEPEEIGEGDRGKVVCCFVGMVVEARSEPRFCNKPAVHKIHYAGEGEYPDAVWACAEHLEALKGQIQFGSHADDRVEEVSADIGYACEFVLPSEDAQTEEATSESTLPGEMPAEEVCVCGHSLEQHGEPGSYCRGSHDCACMFFESAAEAAVAGSEA